MTRIDRAKLAESTRRSLIVSARMFKVAGLSATQSRAESIRIEREFYRNARKAHRIETSATLAALGVPAPRLIATGCNASAITLGVKLAREESELPTCRNVRRLPWIK